jgi:hypothetical protein
MHRLAFELGDSMKLSTCALACAVTLWLTDAATAATISGTGLTTSAIPGGTVVAFDGIVGPFGSILIGNVLFSGDAPIDIGGDYNGLYNTTGGGSLYNNFDFRPLSFRFDFVTPVSAFAFNWGASDFEWTLQAFSETGSLLEASILSPTFDSNLGEFFGISAPGIKYASLFTEQDDFVFIDNFTYATDVSPVPLPAGFSLLLAAIGCLAVFGR